MKSKQLEGGWQGKLVVEIIIIFLSIFCIFDSDLKVARRVFLFCAFILA